MADEFTNPRAVGREYRRERAEEDDAAATGSDTDDGPDPADDDPGGLDDFESAREVGREARREREAAEAVEGMESSREVGREARQERADDSGAADTGGGTDTDDSPLPDPRAEDSPGGTAVTAGEASRILQQAEEKDATIRNLDDRPALADQIARQTGVDARRVAAERGGSAAVDVAFAGDEGFRVDRAEGAPGIAEVATERVTTQRQLRQDVLAQAGLEDDRADGDLVDVEREGGELRATLTDEGAQRALAEGSLEPLPQGREPTSDPVPEFAGRKSKIIGAANQRNPLNAPLAVVLERAGVGGQRVFPADDDPFVPDTPEAAAEIGAPFSDERLNELGINEDTVAGLPTVYGDASQAEAVRRDLEGSAAAAGTEVIPYDGRKSLILGPQAPGNPTDEPQARILDVAGDEGVPVAPGGIFPGSRPATSPQGPSVAGLNTRVVDPDVEGQNLRGQLLTLGAETPGGPPAEQQSPLEQAVQKAVREDVRQDVLDQAGIAGVEDPGRFVDIEREGDQVRAELTDAGLRRAVAADTPLVEAAEVQIVQTESGRQARAPDRVGEVIDQTVVAEAAQEQRTARALDESVVSVAMRNERAEQALEESSVAFQMRQAEARAAAEQEIREELQSRGFPAGGMNVEVGPDGEVSTGIDAPGEYEQLDPLERVLDERVPAAAAGVSQALGLDRLQPAVDRVPEPAATTRGVSPAAGGAELVSATIAGAAELPRLPGRALEATETFAYSGPDMIVSPTAQAQGFDDTRGERADEAAEAAGAIAVGAGRYAERNPREFTSGVLVGSVAETAAYTGIARAASADIPTPDVSTPDVSSSRVPGSGLRTRTPDVTVESDASAGIVEVSPLLRQQVARGVRERLPSGSAETSSAAVFGRSMVTEARQSLSGRAATESRDVFGRPLSQDLDAAAISTRAADAARRFVPEGGATTGSRDVFGRPVTAEAPGKIGAEIDAARRAARRVVPDGDAATGSRDVFGRPVTAEAPGQIAAEIDAARRAVRRRLPAGEAETTTAAVFGSAGTPPGTRLFPAADESTSAGVFGRPLATDVGAEPLSVRARDALSTVLPSGAAATTPSEVFGRAGTPPGTRLLPEGDETASADVFGRPETPDFTLRIGPFRPERRDVGRVPEEDPALGPFADDDAVSDLPSFAEVFDPDADARAVGRGEARVDLDDGTAQVMRRARSDRGDVEGGGRRRRSGDGDGARGAGLIGGGVVGGGIALSDVEEPTVDPGVETNVFRNAYLERGVEAGAGIGGVLGAEERADLGADVGSRVDTGVDLGTRADTAVDVSVRQDVEQRQDLETRLDTEVNLNIGGDGNVNFGTGIGPDGDRDDEAPDVGSLFSDEVFDTGVVQDIDVAFGDADPFDGADDPFNGESLF